MDIDSRDARHSFQTDSCLLFGMALALASILLLAHQWGHIEVRLQELPIEHASKEHGAAYQFAIGKQTSQNALDTNRGLIVQENGQSLKQTLDLHYVRKAPGTFAYSADSLVVSSYSGDKDVAANLADFKVFQPTKVSAWLIGLMAIFGGCFLLAGAFSSLKHIVRTSRSYRTDEIHTGKFAGRVPTALNWGVTLGALLGAWFLTAHMIRNADSFLDRSEFALKLDLAASEEAFPNCVFVGSSRTAYHANPQVLENVLAESGSPMTAYNLGYPGCRAIELPVVLANTFRADTQNAIRYVFIQMEDFNREYNDSMTRSKRAIRAHDLNSIAILTKHYFDNDDLSLLQQLQFTMRRLSMFWRLQSNLGFGGDALDDWIQGGSREDSMLRRRVARYDKGYRALVREEMPKHPGVRAIENILQSQPELSQLPEGRRNKFADSDASRQLIRKVCQMVRSHGAIPVFVETPPNRNESVFAAYREGEIEHMIELNNDQKFPELYSVENYFDFGHLNAEGSEMYSQSLALEFVKIYEEVVNVAGNNESQRILR